MIRWTAPAGPEEEWQFVALGDGLVWRRRFRRDLKGNRWRPDLGLLHWLGPWRLISRTIGLRIVG